MACDGHAPRSKRAAKRALRRLRSQPAEVRPEDPSTLNVWRCESCGRWHVGHDRIGRKAA